MKLYQFWLTSALLLNNVKSAPFKSIPIHHWNQPQLADQVVQNQTNQTQPVLQSDLHKEITPNPESLVIQSEKNPNPESLVTQSDAIPSTQTSYQQNVSETSAVQTDIPVRTDETYSDRAVVDGLSTSVTTAFTQASETLSSPKNVTNPPNRVSTNRTTTTAHLDGESITKPDDTPVRQGTSLVEPDKVSAHETITAPGTRIDVKSTRVHPLLAQMTEPTDELAHSGINVRNVGTWAPPFLDDCPPFGVSNSPSTFVDSNATCSNGTLQVNITGNVSTTYSPFQTNFTTADWNQTIFTKPDRNQSHPTSPNWLTNTTAGPNMTTALWDITSTNWNSTNWNNTNWNSTNWNSTNWNSTNWNNRIGGNSTVNNTENTFPSRFQYWPNGTYALPLSSDECPISGNFSKNWTPLYSWLLPINTSFCIKSLEQESHAPPSFIDWPYGRYCVFANGSPMTCPKRLNPENITLFYSQAPKQRYVQFCCSLNMQRKAIVLPVQDPFYLLPIGNAACPEVQNMTNSKETRILKNEESRLSYVSGSLDAPSHSWTSWNKTFTITYCHYFPFGYNFTTTESYFPTTSDAFNASYFPDNDTYTEGESHTIESTATKPNALIPAIVVPVVSCVGLTIMVVGIVRYCRQRRARLSREHNQSQISIYSLQNPLTKGENDKKTKQLELGRVLTLILDAETQLSIYKLLIDPDKLEMGDKIGKGAFGNVFYGRYKPDNNPLHAQEVAIKTLKDNCGYADINGFMNEALVMSDFHHPNVLGLTGICVKDESGIPIIVLPFMEHGDLQTYLRAFRYDKDKLDKTPEYPQLLSFCLHIARGMNYLAEMKFVHRDLAARNCMINSNMVAKVADFGLTRDIYCSSYYRQDRNKLLPIKWMSIESLQDRVFTTYSDIWSYGITIWEILTLGKVPYPDLENYQVIGFLENGHRLPKPEICSDGLYELILKCWDENPKSRTPFIDICKTLEDTLTGICGYLDLGAEVGYQVPPGQRPALPQRRVSLELEKTSSLDKMLPFDERSSYKDYREGFRAESPTEK